MTRAIELAKECGIAYYLTPENTKEMHGTDRQIEAFAERLKLEHLREFFEIMERSLWFRFNTPRWMKDECRARIECINAKLKTPNALGEGPAALSAAGPLDAVVGRQRMEGEL